MNAIDWTKLPSLTALRAFDATARTRSFSAAARSLNVTHAAVAQQVSALEVHMGVTLVDRSPRGVALTPAGQVLSDHLQQGFAAIADGVGRVLEQDRARPVRVTTTSYFAEAVIFPDIADFWRDNPDIELSFTPSDTTIDLVAEGYDLAVRAGYGNWPDLSVTHLLDSPTLACTAPSLVDDPATNWDRVPWLLPADSFWERDALQVSGIDPDSLTITDLGNPSLEIRAAEEGVGLVLESRIDLKRQLDRGTLKPAPIPIRHVSSYFLVTPPREPRPAVRQFMNWLIRTCGDTR
ncbi:LysR substrate-binding domain-containing protein [Primorskyibacter aestuariivivens]|uniref:LysR substrate-binding domain-containing protein n=1 Tax=Primorskyibacter aestuariivivens TaxID=1888912 RepID=UPI0023009627|nr:LysR substrate-binding domain-containing protein [Primorskyibacter aestuariivivens]MDA7427639.1 LysR substrate-binding domain-containing protein [Primorskyibacter aestuariivivens]